MSLTPTGLAGPAHHGPGPATDVPERPTRKPLPMWDRIKYLLLLGVLFWWFVWSAMADNPLVNFGDAFRMTVSSKWWLFLVAGIEVLRQLHYFVSERSAAYHGWWVRLFSRFEHRTAKFNDWNRFRVSRVLKILFLLAILSLVLAALFDVSPATALFELPARLFAVLPFVLQLAFGFFFVMFQFIGLFWFLSRGGIDVYFPEDIKTRFSDVWGQDHVRDKVRENIIFLEHPDEIEAKGGYVPSGLLLYGPPGTGKTLMAEAVAGETGRPFVFVEPGAFINMFMGVGILKVKGLYRKLRRLALRYGGVVVFFDEADALGNRGSSGATQPGPAGASPWHQSCNGLHYMTGRGADTIWQLAQPAGPDTPKRHGIIMGGMGGGGGGMGTLQALLTEMSGLKKPRGFFNRIVRRWLNMKPKPPPKYRILTMMATNRPDVLDEAMLRPGRIDRKYRVGYPSTDGRERTFEGYLAKVKHVLTPEQVRRLAVTSPYATGATIKDMVNEALVMAIRDDRETITWADMIKAKHLKTHGPADDAKYTDWEGHAVAIHEACHAVAAYRLRKREAIDVATIERRGEVGGFVAPVPLEDQFFDWRTDREADVMTSLASLAGERLFFEGDNSSGVGSDLANATRLSFLMEAFHGMGQSVASHSVTMAQITRASSSVEDGSDRSYLETELGRRVEARLEALLARVTALLDEDRAHVLAIAHALETHKTISGEDVVAVIEGEQGPLVDGRSYHTDDVDADIEAYHDAVVVARKDQARVALPLPVLNGHGVLSSSATEIPGLVHAGAVPERSGNGGPVATPQLPPPSGPPVWLAPPPPVLPESPPLLPEPDSDGPGTDASGTDGPAVWPPGPDGADGADGRDGSERPDPSG
ncbi:MAG: AAA family ATPase [Acidimicrobiales bacterium]